MKKNLFLVAICLAVMFGAIGVLQLSAMRADDRILGEIETASGQAVGDAEIDDIADTMDQVKDQAEETKKANIEFTEDSRGNLVVGAADAPITIHEYSSLSCGHCAAFHANTLPTLKKDYIDDGSVKIIFHDFPLNAQAMDGSKLLRCVSLADRYDFMNLLFEQQPQWAYGDPDYRNKLKQYVALLGMNGETADACMEDDAVQNLIIKDLQAAAADYKIDSTPTFVMKAEGQDTPEIVSGALPYGEFATRIEAMLKAEE